MASHMLSSRRANAYSSFHPCRFRARATIRRCSALGVSTGLMCQRHDVPKRENASRYSRSTSWLRQTSAISSGWFTFLVCTGSFSLPHARRAVFMFLRLSRRKAFQYSAFAGTCRMGVGASFMLIVELSRTGMDRGNAPRRRALPVPRKPLRALVAIVLHRGPRSPEHGRARDAHAGPAVLPAARGARRPPGDRRRPRPPVPVALNGQDHPRSRMTRARSRCQSRRFWS